jgi:hypothetical protein
VGSHVPLFASYSPFSTVPQDAENKGWALQAAEKLDSAAISGDFVTGHDFSRAVNA